MVAVAGSELLVKGSKGIIQQFGLTDIFYGMAVLAFPLSIEEMARELLAVGGPPQRQ